jgi:glycosyltransferase involved in cell wall biosynthesis
MMRVGLVFHKDPLGAPTGIDLVRLRAIALGLAERGVETDIIAPVSDVACLQGSVTVKPLETLEHPSDYSVIKTCYHPSIKLLGRYDGPVTSRIVRVVDKEIPERDTRFRNELLECQTLIKQRAQVVILNNTANLERWRFLYGDNQRLEIVPTGCPRDIPLRTEKPYHGVKPIILFLGSLAAPRMVRTLNALAEMLQDSCEIHLIGSNKTGLYGSGGYLALSGLIHDHGEMSESYTWPYVEHASIGLALATGSHVFDNDLSKMFAYLRGGLPVLSEDTVLTNYLISETRYGSVVPYDDIHAMAREARSMLANQAGVSKHAVMKFMIENHSWDKRVETLLAVFRKIARST